MKHTDELLKLANGLIRKISRRKKGKLFDIEIWDCGTPACAIGHMPTLVPETKLRFDRYSGCPEIKQAWGYGALEDYFDLSESEVVYLFSSLSYPRDKWRDAKYVGERIRKFVNENRSRKAARIN